MVLVFYDYGGNEPKAMIEAPAPSTPSDDGRFIRMAFQLKHCEELMYVQIDKEELEQALQILNDYNRSKE